MGPDRYNFGGGSPGAIVSCRDQDGRNNRDLSGVAFPGPGRSEKIAQFYSVLLSFGQVRAAEWIERRIEQNTAVKKIMVRLGAVESLWVPLGAERFGSSLRISELLSQ